MANTVAELQGKSCWVGANNTPPHKPHKRLHTYNHTHTHTEHENQAPLLHAKLQELQDQKVIHTHTQSHNHTHTHARTHTRTHNTHRPGKRGHRSHSSPQHHTALTIVWWCSEAIGWAWAPLYSTYSWSTNLTGVCACVCVCDLSPAITQ